MQTRIFCTNLLSYLGLTKKPIHLLGLGNPLELKYQRKHNFVFRVDSSAAYDCGSQGFKFDKELGYNRKIRKLDFGSSLEKLVEYNMKMVNDYTGVN